MGRPRSFSEENILKAAAKAFVRGGYEGTSVDDLVRALKVHRGSLYKALGSKHGLFLAVLRPYVRADLPDAINRSCTSGGAGVSALLDSGDLDLLLVAALDRAPVDAQVAGREAEAVSPPAGEPRPVRALNLLGARLYERLHNGLDEKTRRPPLTTAKGN